jgi:hypothetical protein
MPDSRQPPEMRSAARLDVNLVHIEPPAEAGPARRLLAAEPFIGDGPFVANVAGSLTHHDLGRRWSIS